MIRRWMWFLVGVFLAAGPMLAFADYSFQLYWPGGGAVWRGDPGGGAPTGDTADSVCSQHGVTFGYQPGVWYAQEDIPTGTGGRSVQCYNSVNGAGTVRSAYTYVGCPYGGTISGSQCVGEPACPTGQVRDPATGQCVAPPCQAGSQYSAGYYDYGLQPDSKMVVFGCAGGCEVTFSGDVPAGRQLVGGVYHYFAKGSYDRTGGTCTTGPTVGTATPAMPPAGCGPNQGTATMSGKTVCVDESTGTVTNPYAPVPPPDTTSNTQTTQNPDGSTTTITETCTGPNACTTTTQTCTGPNSCTSTTTTTGGGAGGGSGPGAGPGAGPGKDADGDGKPDYDADGNPLDPQQDDSDQCQKTPDAAMCKEKIPIEEEGVEESYDYTEEKGGVNQAYDDWLSLINGRSWERMELGFVWSPPTPSGSCSGVSVFGYTIPVCESLEKAREWWSWCVYVLAGLAIWIRGTRALAGV